MQRNFDLPSPLSFMQRRQWLTLAASSAVVLAAPPAAWAAAARPGPPSRTGIRLAAAWEGATGYQVGVLKSHGADHRSLKINAAIDLPTRAHGLLPEPGGTMLAVARRPGDWLLRWRPDGTALAWSWVEPGRALNGHVIHSADGRTLYTTETDLETGAGLIGLRDAATLEKTGEWRTGGMGPHELLLDADGSLVVANGGIPSRPEMGRAKTQLQQMDPSLVRLDTHSGEVRSQWRLADPRLSLRHIAWGAAPQAATGDASRRLLGIALQAEHDDPAAKAAAPVLAVFDGRTLQPWPQSAGAAAGTPLAGYGGDIASIGGGFAVSCPRAHGVALWRADGRWAGFLPLQEACALAGNAGSSKVESGTHTTNEPPDLPADLFAGGRQNAMRRDPAGSTGALTLPGVRLDNHWIALS